MKNYKALNNNNIPSKSCENIFKPSKKSNNNLAKKNIQNNWLYILL